eukprot:CAMPEP_0172179934 /NCGR_PEP_ID=MMETSP1050-20130122/16909_1 /TAXON_ID=233186 /ORGANISM="Cryptomonas curvata, Strain CCAP979/52" /LENGTH=179 /DNA_ID=CAMNT_0012852903 /DNA_START=13 /DNA_END=552 /DNA_ORIENTATION=-
MIKAIASLAICAGSALAFAPGATLPLRTDRVARSSAINMAEQSSRREMLQAGAALVAGFAATAPAFADPANVFSGKNGIQPKVNTGFLGTSVVGVGSAGAPKGKNFAPVITIFDERKCDRVGNEYKGSKSGDYNDQMTVKVELQPIVVVESNAAKFTYEQLGFIGGGGGVPSGLLPAKK